MCPAPEYSLPAAPPASLPADLGEVVQKALEEDIGSGDLSAALVEEARPVRGHILVREAAVLCGQPWVEEVFRRLDPRVRLQWRYQDGDTPAAGEILCHLDGPARPILSGERTALNFLQLLSGTATLSRAYAERARGAATVLLDTRKTLPGLRSAQKYAVRCGGCHNHRMGLFDALLLKENHQRAAASLKTLMGAARARFPQQTLEVEVRSLEELRRALELGAELILLDNFTLPQLRQAVRMGAGKASLEASGNIHLENLEEILATGVERVSIGALTKHCRSVDMSLCIESSED